MARGNSVFMASKLIFIPILIVVIIVIVILVFLFSAIYSIIEGIIGKKNMNIIGAIFELIYVCLNWLFAACVFWYSKFHKNVILPFVIFITPFFIAVWNFIKIPFVLIWNLIIRFFLFLFGM
uniref:Uncharacterized protein n=1 Tax=viral metagenome TaxID=1070528 RepID=A0A6C0H2E1_9ZZZZ